MTEEDISQCVSTAVGGLIAIICYIAGMFATERLTRRK